MNHQDLETEIWAKGLCRCCGACAAVCPARTIKMSESGPSYEGCCRELDGIPCGACYNSCAAVTEPTPAPGLKNIYAARAVQQPPFAQSGGAVTALLASALDAGFIDGAMILNVDRLTKQSSSIVACDPHDLFNASGSRYSWGSPLECLGDAVKQGYKRLAVVGMPCTIQSLRRIMASDLDVLQCYGKCISLTAGLFCSAIFNGLEAVMSGRLNVPIQQIGRIEISGSIRVFLPDDRIEIVPISALRQHILPGCSRCRDFSAQQADISAGETGSKKGYTTLIVRTPTGEAVLRTAVNSSYIELSEEINYEEIRIKEEEKACAP